MVRAKFRRIMAPLRAGKALQAGCACLAVRRGGLAGAGDMGCSAEAAILVVMVQVQSGGAVGISRRNAVYCKT